jgi:ribonuclease HI
MKEVIIYTDGACSGNPGPGGWGALYIYNKNRKTISGGEKLTTNNRMEMMAALEAMKQLKEPCKIKLYTDSKYLQQGATQWMKKWKLNNWKKGNIMIKNDDLWKAISEQMDKHQVEFFWVRGHSNNIENNIVDELAREACKKFC